MMLTQTDMYGEIFDLFSESLFSVSFFILNLGHSPADRSTSTFVRYSQVPLRGSMNSITTEDAMASSFSRSRPPSSLSLYPFFTSVTQYSQGVAEAGTR